VRLLNLCVLALLTACDSNIDGYIVERAYKVCKDHGGVSKLTTEFQHKQPNTVTCMDGTFDSSVWKRYPISEQPAPAAMKIGAEDNPVAFWPRQLGPLIRTG
jgi:hypothetical protein